MTLRNYTFRGRSADALDSARMRYCFTQRFAAVCGPQPESLEVIDWFPPRYQFSTVHALALSRMETVFCSSLWLHARWLRARQEGHVFLTETVLRQGKPMHVTPETIRAAPILARGGFLHAVRP